MLQAEAAAGSFLQHPKTQFILSPNVTNIFLFVAPSKGFDRTPDLTARTTGHVFHALVSLPCARSMREGASLPLPVRGRGRGQHVFGLAQAYTRSHVPGESTCIPTRRPCSLFSPPDSNQVHTLTLPGRGRLRSSSLVTDMPSVVARCVEEIRKLVGKHPAPVFFYGASLGCLVAFEVARALAAAAPSVAPKHLFVAGHIAPRAFAALRAKPGAEVISKLPDAGFRAALAKYNLVDPQLLADADFGAMFLPVIRADLVLDESYDFKEAKDGGRAPCPITAFSGGADAAAAPSQVKAWATHSPDGKLDDQVIFADLGHEFLVARAEEICERVCRTLFTKYLFLPFHELLLRRGRAHPTQVCVRRWTGVMGSKDPRDLLLTDVCVHARRFASALYAAGVRPRTYVLLVSHVSYAGALTFLTTSLMGAAATVVSHGATREDLDNRVKKLQAKAVVFLDPTGAREGKSLPAWLIAAKANGIPVFTSLAVSRAINNASWDEKGRYGDPDGPWDNHEPQIPWERNVRRNDPAFVAFTSGSTGLPKGMPIAHRSVTNNMFWRMYNLPMKPGDTFCMSIFWFWYWFVAICEGAAISIVKPWEIIDPETFCSRIQSSKITTVDVTPSLLGEMVNTAGKDRRLAGVKRFVTYGEPLTLEVCEAVHAALPKTQLINLYSTTENNDLSWCDVTREVVRRTRADPLRLANAPIGQPVWNVDLHLEPVLEGKFEMYAAGAAMPLGYVGLPDKNKKALVKIGGKAMYRCGDLVAMSGPDMVILGRADAVVNVRGFRVGMGSVNAALLAGPGVLEASAQFHKKTNTLVGFVAMDSALESRAAIKTLRSALKGSLEAHAIPSRFVCLRRMPKNERGKIDKRELMSYLVNGVPADNSPNASSSAALPKTPPRSAKEDVKVAPPTTSAVAAAAMSADSAPPALGPLPPDYFLNKARAVWRDVLQAPPGEDTFEPDDDFFEVGGHSLIAIKLAKGLGVSMPDIMTNRTLQEHADLLERIMEADLAQKRNGGGAPGSRWDEGTPSTVPRAPAMADPRSAPIAVVGLAGRWPNAVNTQQFWANLCKASDSFSELSTAELSAAGVPRSLYESKNYVRRAAAIPSEVVEKFEPEFFGLAHREAELTDPNQRVLLEVAYEALEDAGYDPFSVGSSTRVGVFASGPSLPTYLFNCIKPDLTHMMLHEPGAYVRAELGNDKDYIAPRVSFCLNLTGPSRTIQSACSSTLVCVTEAVQALRRGEIGMALAGGISIQCPMKTGYLYQEGMVLSPDGRVRPFDAAARGTIFTNGAAVVALKPLAQALADGDQVYGVIRGVSDNNDGKRGKKFFAAPSAEGQAEMVEAAMRNAKVNPRDISYVEAHGTGTLVGDPIEFQGLKSVYTKATLDKQYCAIGSVKGHIGHPNTAAGVCALSKVLLMLRNKMIPPVANYKKPNPAIDFENSPFYPATRLQPWPEPTGGAPRRAGQSACGMGGTNAHVIVEEYLADAKQERNMKAAGAQTRAPRLVVVSGRTRAGLLGNISRLNAYFAAEEKSNSDESFANAAFTLATGRHPFRQFRWSSVVRSANEARQRLASALEDGAATAKAAERAGKLPPRVVLLFSGQGSQYVGMGDGLYGAFPAYRQAIDQCSAALGYDVREPAAARGGKDSSRWAQVAVFCVSFALTRLLEALGVRAWAVCGHSVGEYAAAVCSGVMKLEEALVLVDERGRLMDKMEEGAMLAVFSSAGEVRKVLSDTKGADVSGCVLACDNAPDRVVVSGPRAQIVALQTQFQSQNIRASVLKTAKAFHSPSVTPALLSEFKTQMAKVGLSAPALPMLCNKTGAWLTAQDAADSDRWVSQMRSAVRFRECIAAALGTPPVGQRGARRKGLSDRRIFVEVGPGKSLASLAKRCLPKSGVAHSSINLTRHPKDNSGDVAAFMAAVGELWRRGVAVDMKSLFRGSAFVQPDSAVPTRVSLPTYAFDRRRCWVGPSDLDAREIVYKTQWKEAPRATPQAEQQVWPCVFASSADAKALEGAKAFATPLAETGGADGAGGWDFSPALEKGKLLFVGAAAMGNDEADAAEAIAVRMLRLVQSLTRAIEDKGGTVTVQLCVCVPAAPRYSGAWGVAKVAALESPNLEIRRVAWGGADSTGSVAALGKALAATQALSQTPPESYFSDGAVLVPRLERAAFKPPAAGAQPPSTFRNDCLYMITGGTKGIGLRLAQWLVSRRGVRHLALVGRSAPSEACLSAIRTMQAAGASVAVERADVTDRKAIAALVARLRQAKPAPLAGIFHSAGVLHDGVINNVTPAQLRKVMSVKTAAWTLHEATSDQSTAKSVSQLDFLVLFSSTSALFGQAGQASYVAANYFLESLATTRSARGLPTLAVQWGAWGEVGMSVDSGLKEGAGERHLAPEEALDALGRVMDYSLARDSKTGVRRVCAAAAAGPRVPPGPAQFAIVKVTDWDAFARNPACLEEGPRGLVEGLTDTASEDTGSGVADGASGSTDSVAEFLKSALQTNDLSGSLSSGGYDSLDIIIVRNQLKAKFGKEVTLPLDRFFDTGVSIQELAKMLEQKRGSLK